MHPIIDKLLNTKFNPEPEHSLNVFAYRSLMNDFTRIATYSNDGTVEAKKITLRPEGLPSFHLRIYQSELTRLSPVLIYFHGGNWISGNVQHCESICAMLSENSGYTVISVGYALAPEWNFPIQLYQGLAVLDWIQEQGVHFGLDSSQIVVGGDNSGGNIAAGLIHLAEKERDLKLFGQLLICPALHYRFDTSSYKEYGEGYFISKQLMQHSWDMYLGNPNEAYNELASPLLTGYVKHVPQTLLYTAEYDPLRDEAELYAERLQRQGIPVCFKRFKGVAHHFWQMDAILDVAREAHIEAAQWLTDLTVV
jgi:acetyl esterase